MSVTIQAGEGEQVEFKESVSSSLAREIVAFANTRGGVIYIGIDDSGRIVGTSSDNTLLSQIQDVARNCDPPIPVKIVKLPTNVLAIEVLESSNKPHQCRDGFFIRAGASSQKLRRDELLTLLATTGSIAFDRAINQEFVYPADFSEKKFQSYRGMLPQSAPRDVKHCLPNLGAAAPGPGDNIQFANAAVLFFAESPQLFFPEGFISCVRYQGVDRSIILDRHDFKGSLIEQIEAAFLFVTQHQKVAYVINTSARREERYEYPQVAVREIIVNAVMHRDYFYQSSHVYLSLYADRLEVENPGGLMRGMTTSDLGKLSVRRNPLIAQLLQRAGYVEAVGSGFSRIHAALKENGNPLPLVDNTNFFRVTILARDVTHTNIHLSQRQERILALLKDKQQVKKRECAEWLRCSEDTALRELRRLLESKLIVRDGTGRGTLYRLSHGI